MAWSLTSTPWEWVGSWVVTRRALLLVEQIGDERRGRGTSIPHHLPCCSRPNGSRLQLGVSGITFSIFFVSFQGHTRGTGRVPG